MSYIPNEKKINAGDKINYIDHGGNTHKATMRELTNNHYAELEHNSQVFAAVPYSVTLERHTWHHAAQEEAEKEADSGSTEGKQQRQGRAQDTQEGSAQGKESAKAKSAQTSSSTSN